jgi:AraC-like DNA-binding protein
MEELYEKLSKDAEYCINCLDVDVPCLLVPWHFHPETEILYIMKGTGSRFVGDHSESFGEGDVGLIGPNLPHVWKSDPIYKENIPGLTTHVLVVHFQDTIFKGPLAILPEMEGINKLLFESQFGIKFTGKAKTDLSLQIKEIINSKGLEKVSRLLLMLDYMAKTDEKKLLASAGYSKIRKSADFNRFDKAHRYMIENFQKNITLETVADIVGMTNTSFCRYFKKHTGKSFLTVLNEIRIGHACKLLIENKMNISGISYESGFSNLSNFNDQFKKIKGTTPSQFIKIRQNTAKL